ncbi:MAG TPA: methionine ABC transporter ATP-binding protein [Clostridia bacterium]|nr:methionine ABC transporter ATP-binding protein [Clostridia bacterium]
MIRITDLSKVFTKGTEPVVALDGVSLHVKRGEIFGIIGLSGAGKSTLVRCINMLERPTAGQIFVDGLNIRSLKPAQLREARREIGMIFQHFNLLWSRTVFENIAFPLEIAGLPKDKIGPRVDELLELVGLTDKARSYPNQLSGGQKQRVGIARALANNPKVLLCDEATSALDPQTTKSILGLLRDINKQLNLTIVIITHEMNVIKEICDTVAVIENARIVETGPVIDLFTRPRTPTARRFINTVINTELPSSLILNQNDNGGKIIRIAFIGETAGQPIISNLVTEFGVQANILFGNIDHIKDTIFGTLTVQLLGPPEALEKGLDYLQSMDLRIEVL